jgi:hypothetical protein
MEGKEYRVRDMVIKESDRKKSITVGTDHFIILAPFPKDRKNITKQVVYMCDGLPVSSFGRDERDMFERDATLNILIEESPIYWKTAEDCIDEDLKNTIYQEILTWDTEFQSKLKKNGFPKFSAEKPI